MDFDAVVAAAGLSSRMGFHKLLMDLGGKTLIEHTIEPMHEVCRRIIVVGGYRINALKETLQKYPRVKVVYNPVYYQEMLESIKAGCKYVEAERFFFTPADCPLIKKTTYLSLLSVEADIVLPVHNGYTGHPVLMRRNLISELLSCDSASLRSFILERGAVTLEVQDPGVLIDVDTIRDYLKVRKMLMGEEEAVSD